MSDRLKQIWKGFEGKTDRRLTGGGVDNIVMPERRGFAEAQPAYTIDETTGPAAAAASALRARLLEQDKAAKSGRKARRRAGDQADFAGEDAAFSAGREPGLTLSYDGAPPETKAMLRGLKATQDRIDRPQALYTTSMSSRAGAELRSLKKRKKFLGVF